MWRNDDCPCTQDCPMRDPYCHGVCGEYKKWSQKRADDKKAHDVQKERSAMTHAHKHRFWNYSNRHRPGSLEKIPN